MLSRMQKKKELKKKVLKVILCMKYSLAIATYLAAYGNNMK